MSLAQTPTQRSRNGCRECRRRHRRCDEGKPSCKYCRSVSIACEYARELSWGGRPFKKSRFGLCLNKHSAGIYKAHSPNVDYSTAGVNHIRCQDRRSLGDQFVYASSPANLEKSGLPYQQYEQIQQHDDCITLGSTSHRPPTGSLGLVQALKHSLQHRLDTYPELDAFNPRQSILLDYFQHATSKSLSCHEEMQHDICSALVPMAMASEQVMAALLCVAFSHRLSVGLERTEADVFRFHATSVKLLQDGMSVGSGQQGLLVALATSLVLCLSNIVSSSSHRQDWIVHLKGASALVQRLEESGYEFEHSKRVLLRLYTSLTTIAALRHTPVNHALYNISDRNETDDYIDDLAGFSKSLKPIIEAVQGQAALRKAMSKDSTELIMLQEQHLHHTRRENQDLVLKLNSMLERRTLQFLPEIAERLSAATKRDFWLLDEAYHHMVLIQLYKRLDSTATSLEYSRQFSVQRIISCIGSMDIMAKPCPGVATLPPLFEAGCAATSASDRWALTKLLSHIRACFGMGNVACTADFLKKLWSTEVRGTEFDGSDSDDIDFLPY
ncbi:uncharacterized protein HMPREF1541_05267 [Cyphellophora europaea CBS 101466]|uniref:Zn(2)-C6 fungal-type domain-containing protein n=1 Tax=Cyphellophora europaea (strain CBS 101466) TaxID=1220924 RepID=W2RRV6_CYPE1|nr:uncharacterized protein HMPREF1541_05267 [Cyphellophora europaea CBS 101466]ETN39045.1 hypothetical protein HMPREF1541_05267 [Cyphellophora europaea CBS 101466]